MTFTYSPGAPTDKDRIRARIGDTDSSAPTTSRLEDEEIADFVLTEGGFRIGAAACAEALSAKFSRLCSQKTVGSLTLMWRERANDLLALAKQLRAGAAMTASPIVGGISSSDKDASRANSDRVTPVFSRGMQDNPPTGEGSGPLPSGTVVFP